MPEIRPSGGKPPYVARLEQLEDRVVPTATRVYVNVGPNITNLAAVCSTSVPVFIDIGQFWVQVKATGPSQSVFNSLLLTVRA